MRTTVQLTAAALALSFPFATHAQETELHAGGEVAQPPDVDADRAFLLPTAETQPQGSISVSTYDLITYGLTYGLTDDLQVSGLVMLPAFAEPDNGLAALSVKYRVVGQGRLHAAVQGMAGWFGGEGIIDDPTALYSLSAIGGYCLDARCSSLISTNVTWMIAGVTLGSPDEQMVMAGLSWVQKVHPNGKVLIEVIGEAHDDAGGWELSRGALVNYGFRATSGTVSGDIGFMKPLDSDLGDDTIPIGYPFVSLTYRAL